VTFDDVARAVAGIPFMAPEQGRIVYDHVRAIGASDVLELGTAHGVGAAYLAAAGARVTPRPRPSWPGPAWPTG
jgi:predicted O-methyltransferase YrrM